MLEGAMCNKLNYLGVGDNEVEVGWVLEVKVK